MVPGYAGRLLTVDLTAGRLADRPLDEGRLRACLGGSALAASLLLEEGDPAADPLAPESPLLVMTGPLTGSGFPGTSRFAVCARSPLTGIWGEAACGGSFGPELKRAGYDGLIITGRADAPVRLALEDGGARLEAAGDLWGRDLYETTDRLKARDPRCKVLAIGPAGEHRVRFAAIGHDKAHFIGRTGLGAVMGSKRLKAITAAGSARPTRADDARFRAAIQAARAELQGSALAGSLHAMGSDAAMELGMLSGDVPVKNWTEGEASDLAAALGGPTLTERYLTRTHACAHCPIACKRVVRVEGGPWPTEEGPGPEYETCATFGTLILNGDLAAVIRANALCNRLGLDTISAGAVVAWAMECAEKGILTPADTDGLDLAWGNMADVLTLLPRIARREGFGDRLAEGSRRAAEGLGEAAREAVVHVKGLEMPMHDPRAFHGMGLAYMMSNRGACHLQHAVLAVEQGMAAWPQLLPLAEDFTGPTSEGKAALVYHAENYGILGNALAICHYLTDCLRPETIRDALRAVTGFEIDFAELLACGARDWMRKRVLNVLFGVRAADDVLPRRILTPLASGGAAGSVPEMARLRNEYYALRGLDERGIPRAERLREMGLATLIGRLPAGASPERKEG